MIKLTFFFAALLLGLPLIISEVEASHQLPPNLLEIEKGPNFDRRVLEVTDEGVKYEWISAPERMLDPVTNLYEDYLLTETDTMITVETAQGSFTIDKVLCNFAFYNGGFISGNPTIPSDTYIARQSADGLIFNNVNQINNAQCKTVVIESGANIEVQIIKSHAIGEMKIRYIKNVGQQLKSQMEVINTSGLNDRFFGFTQILEVPQIIDFGDKRINLAGKDGQFYDRQFIKDNKANILKLTDKIGYDFDKGFKNLKGITVDWTGTKAFLELDYSHNPTILPDGSTFIIDPTYAFTNASDSSTASTQGITGPICTGVWNDVFDADIAGSAISLTRFATTLPATCTKTSLEWDISSIPLNADIDEAILKYSIIVNIALPNFTTQACDMVGGLTTQPSTRIGGGPVAAEAYWWELGNATVFYDNWIGCATDVTNSTEQLTSNVLSDIRSHLTGGWFALGFQWQTYEPRNSTNYLMYFNFTNGNVNELSINYTLGFFPDAVTSLLISDVRATTLDLDWTEPFVNGTTTGYQINFTSPQGQPNTIILNNTNSTDTSFEVSGLTQLTPYSFRIGVYTNNSVSNMTGNIANTTTVTLGNFTVGFFELNATQADARLFKYNRIDVSSTQVDLEVTYPSAFNTSCNFYYKFAQSNDTYYNLPHVSLPATSEDRATFRFNDIQNEIINVNCRDETSLVSAPYLLTQVSFPLLQQFINFSDGTYGTQGNFGAIDLITLGVIIVMMVGFNRVNESVGAIFAVIILGFFAFFDVVEWFSFMFGTFAVVIMLTIASTRKM